MKDQISSLAIAVISVAMVTVLIERRSNLNQAAVIKSVTGGLARSISKMLGVSK